MPNSDFRRSAVATRSSGATASFSRSATGAVRKLSPTAKKRDWSPEATFCPLTRISRRSVEIPVTVNDLAYYDVTQATSVLEGLEHEVHVGTSSRDLPLSVMLTVAPEQGVSIY